MINILKQMHSPRNFSSPPHTLPGMTLESLHGGRNRVSFGVPRLSNSTFQSQLVDDSPTLRINLKTE